MDRYQQQFLVVAELKSISKAAEYLHLSQPTVSANLQRLEQHYGVKLCQRQSRGIRLTEFGEVVARHCREMQQRQQRLQNELQDLQQRKQGKIRLGCGDAWWELFVRDVVDTHLADSRGGLILNLGNHLEQMAQLLAGKIDCFIGHQIPGLSRRHPVDFIPLFHSSDASFVSRHHPLLHLQGTEPPHDSGQYPLLAVTPDNDALLDLLDDPLPKRQLQQSRQQMSQPLYEVSSLAASIDLLHRTQAVMPYPRAMTAQFATAGVVPLPTDDLDDDETASLIGLYQHQAPQSEQTLALITHLTRAATEFARQCDGLSPVAGD